MQANNLTTSFNDGANSTSVYDYYYEYEIFSERLADNWVPLLGSLMGSLITILIIAISLFNKRINGDYKWFIINQAFAYFILAFGNFILCAAFEIGTGINTWDNISNRVPFWYAIENEIISLEFGKIGEYGPNFALLATMVNRWMSLALPHYYPDVMSTRLIIFYCVLCNVFALLFDLRLFSLFLSDQTTLNVVIGLVVVPWIIALAMCVIVLVTVQKQLRSVSSITNEKRLKDNRNLIISLLIQVLVPLLDRLPNNFYLIALNYKLMTFQQMKANPIIFYGWMDLTTFNLNFSSVYAGLVILITMKPYRDVWIEWVLKVAKTVRNSCENNSKGTVTTIATSSTVIHVHAV
jgi:hypothetical protein